jgi:hypothetical protein
MNPYYKEIEMKNNYFKVLIITLLLSFLLGVMACATSSGSPGGSRVLSGECGLDEI